MATVVSMTEDKIRELLAGWEGVSLSQDEINSILSQILIRQDSDSAELADFRNNSLPQLYADLEEGSNRISDLNDNVLPNLQNDLIQAQQDVENMRTVDIPSIQDTIANELENTATRPKVYRQPDPPDNPDVDDRDLVVGDTWFDSDDNDTMRLWNGVEWSTFAIDIPDLSLTVRKFNTSTHMIY